MTGSKKIPVISYTHTNIKLFKCNFFKVKKKLVKSHVTQKQLARQDIYIFLNQLELSWINTLTPRQTSWATVNAESCFIIRILW